MVCRRDFGEPLPVLDLGDPSLVDSEKCCDVMVPITTLDHSPDQGGILRRQCESAGLCA